MIKLFCHESIVVIHNIKNILEHEGIACRLKNDMVSGGTGEIPPIETWPEIWIERELDLDRANELVKKAIHGDPTATSWLCPKCGEKNEPAFEICWHCGEDPQLG